MLPVVRMISAGNEIKLPMTGIRRSALIASGTMEYVGMVCLIKSVASMLPKSVPAIELVLCARPEFFRACCIASSRLSISKPALRMAAP